ncbi:MAG: HAD-IIIA family hydrolase [Lachnospiraceae bacterium]|nr:HAD-IIIA family hydrolase [Lachnospiraceae bacterium]
MDGNIFAHTPCSDFQAVVLMGGLGTRLKEYTKEVPKPLVDVCGKPFFDYELMLLKHYGFKKFLFLIGYRAEMIEEYYGDGSSQGISIKYCYDGKELLGTGGAVRRAYDLLEDDFLVIYGDSFMDIDYEETIYRYLAGKTEGRQALMTVLKNNNRFDKSNVIVKDGKIVLYDKHNVTDEMDYIDYGVCIYEKSLFKEFAEGEKFDIAVLQHRLSREGKLSAHIVNKRFYEIGSPESLAEFKGYIQKRLMEKRPAVFLDRDGVLDEIVFNEDIEQLDAPLKLSEFKLFDYAKEAVRLISEKGYYVFIATNQPGAAKGKTKLLTLYDINNAMVSDFKDDGIEIDAVLSCIHYPKRLPYIKDGYLGDFEGFLIQPCDCRKPKPGLIFRPKDIYNIDYENSYMVGDSLTDVQAGREAGVRTVFIGDLKCDACKKMCDASPDMTVKDLMDFARKLNTQ